MKSKSQKITSNKKRMELIIDILSKLYPDVKIQLNHTNAFELLIATILSAQCTDARVNLVTENLFRKYKKPEDYLNVAIEELEKDIYSTGYYKAKAKNIKALCEILITKYAGQVPNTLDELIKLPGVGRKTANVILGHCFNTPAIVVDTHVIRITNLLGFVKTKNAEKIEFELMKLIKRDLWVTFTHYFINHGRKICIARRPKCSECAISHLCPSFKTKIN